MKERIIERFLKYVTIDTESVEESQSTPSSQGQMTLAQILQIEMQEIGIIKNSLTENAYLYGFIPGTNKKAIPIGFVAHLDTAPAVSGKNVKPVRFHYKGGGIHTSNKTVILRENNDLLLYKGEEIIMSDGTTLLGADNKAGIAEIMSACEYIIKNSDSLSYPDIYIAFVPDEEIGHQLALLDKEVFKPTIAFTIDGGAEGEIESGCFNAYSADIKFNGKNCHPGYAKGNLVSSIELMSCFLRKLYEIKCSPNEATEEEGFIHVTEIRAIEENGTIHLLIRDFKNEGIDEKKSIINQLITDCYNHFKTKYNIHDYSITVDFKKQYSNMEYEINKHKGLMEKTAQAVKEAGVDVKLKKIRGGTDGSALTQMGIPCPNIFTGGHNFHSKTEWIAVSSMEKAVKSIIGIVCKDF